ncbi:hypothetical protein ACOQFV_04910 [Nocardiopsis changdeensis]|uniref:Uncharacterized protein n=1 Tax=Nocardiopsis changdeensis TaxID=2831969 RepID=A0ABX8BQ77_9ACTN|nr:MULTISPECIES: hypothetical protein [Nocardiopsis]QUX23227.1 hypothetical protein KGD84_02165 [Nocardiopsis changdeensis]QYX39169.1 hypothetical protein K1J57_11615 [Nocardiopsis sp. MT53]
MPDERILVLAAATLLVLAVQGVLHFSLVRSRVHLPEGTRLRDLPNPADGRRLVAEYESRLLERRSADPSPDPGPRTPPSPSRPPSPTARAWAGSWPWAALILLIGVCTLAGW